MSKTQNQYWPKLKFQRKGKQKKLIPNRSLCIAALKWCGIPQSFIERKGERELGFKEMRKAYLCVWKKHTHNLHGSLLSICLLIKKRWESLNWLSNERQ